MKSLIKPIFALLSLLGAFYLSISWRYGDPGWALEFRAAPRAQAQSEVVDGYDLKSLTILNRAVIHIKENYVDPARINERKMLGAAMEQVQRAVAELLVDVQYDAEKVPTRLTVRIDRAEQTFDLADVGNLWQMSFKFKDIFRFIQENLRHHKKLRDIEYAAINGMLSTLDPHSVLLRPEDYREMKLSTRGKFGGLGIVISIRDGHLTIVNPIEDTPATRAGLRAGDRIVQIGLDSTVNMALNDAVNMLRGDPDTQVDIWVLREGWKKPRKFTLTRDNIKVKSVASTLLDGDVGLVKLRNFQNTTFDELRGAMGKLNRKAHGRLRGLVLDLRGNPGGLLDQAIKVSDLFIASGPLVTTVGFGDKMREPKMATRAGTEGDLPLVVLTDAQSASASEIVAGALKNHHRALLVGQQTFGKGSVQVIYDNKDDSALKLTIAQYLTPGDVSIQSVGITPDVLTQPIIVDEKGTDLFRTDDEQGGERTLPEHLEHASAAASKADQPAFSMEYLVDLALQKQIEENPNDLIVDFEVALARDLLGVTQASNRDDMLTEVGTTLDGRKKTEQARIIEALGARGVDWTLAAAPTHGAPRAEVQLSTDQAHDRVRAGETITVEATVRNTGDAPLGRLYAVTASDNELLAGHEFIFGNLAPGERRTWKVPIKLPRSALSRRDAMTLQFEEATGRAPSPAKLKIEVEQLPHPRFAFTWRIDDRTTGNGDGLLQLGEEAEMVVDVRNEGPGDSFELLGTLRNDESDLDRGVFIRKGRVKGDGLPVGGTATLRFGFKVKAEKPGAVPVMVAIADGETRETTAEKLLLPVLGAEVVPDAARVRLLAHDGGDLQLRGAAHGDAVPVALAGGFAVADARLGQWYRVPTDAGFTWVDGTSVAVDDQVEARPQIRAVEPNGPPVITLSDRTLAVETHDDALTLSGEILSRRLVKDLLIYVNNRKVFFQSNADDAVADRLPFSARVPLEEGVNRITVIAREDEEAATRKTVIVNRAR